ncbi:M23 family metallopeptidase [Fodinibius sediminis]|uniref:Peptidase family M23 n=1 Tax=Fodinibius sediminis TaxID=1214077 RepID=A0A521DT21_9BACT|nr:M23 family metallopeptidase [Fodinibius sediminis]SMO74732.1 Peptidase family M23 [Fodinibius sediminis]
MKKIILLSLIVILFPLSITAQPNQRFDPSEATYLWPTNASHHLTSTFAETRTGHFHAALDIKTWGRKGYEIYATRDGVVHRLAVGPRGYGKVIYLKHDDGSFSVYAHLMSFNDRLQQFSDSLRFAENYVPSFDRVVEAENIRVKQGDLIAYSGASGIGPPHLHFELRTPDQRPFNPLKTNLTVRDNIAPKITGLSVEPLAPGSFVEGRKQIHTRRPRRQNGSYHFGTFDVSGRVGLGLNAYDQSNGVSNAYAVYELSMSVDGRELFRSKVDSFSYAETNQMFIDRVYPLLRSSGQAYQRLFVADGNTLSFYQTDGRKGQLALSAGEHAVEITATDYFGNKSRAFLTLRVHERSTPRFTGGQPRFFPKKIREIDINNWRWFDNWVLIPEEDYSELTVATPDPWRLTSHGENIIVDLDLLDNFFMNIPGMSPTIFHRMQPEHRGLITSVNRQAMALFPKHSFYDTVSVTLSAERFSTDSIRVIVGPEAYPLNKEYTLMVERDSMLTDTSKLAFYKHNKRYNRWYWIPTRFTDSHMIAETNTLGTFISRRDREPPRLSRPRLHQRPDGQWLIYINASDQLSGIDEKRTRISVNGQRGLGEYEPEDGRIVYYHPRFQPSSSMDIQVEIYDRMGNKTEQMFHLGQ